MRDPEKAEKYIGSDTNWELAESAIINAANEKNLNYVIEYGEAAFYGPKLDFMVKDAIGRKWQLGTIQVDYNLPERFELTYKGSDNDLHRPVMIHRAPFGKFRTICSILLEHTGGNFPLWLTPEQVIILSVVRNMKNTLKKFQMSWKITKFAPSWTIEMRLLERKFATPIEKVPLHAHRRRERSRRRNRFCPRT